MIVAKKYKKLPVEIEAIQFDGSISNAAALEEWSDRDVKVNIQASPPTLLIKTLENPMEGRLGDMIIKGVKGEFYACKPDVFAMTYEEAD
jgi:hypothetical protein